MTKAMVKIYVTPQIKRFNHAVENADLFLGPDWSQATVEQLIAELCKRKLYWAAIKLRTAAEAVGEVGDQPQNVTDVATWGFSDSERQQWIRTHNTITGKKL